MNAELALLKALRDCEASVHGGASADAAVRRAALRFSVDAGALRRLWLEKLVARDQAVAMLAEERPLAGER